MKSNFCQTVENVLWRYVDRELPARELGKVTQHLQDCGHCRKIYEERVKESRLYRLAFTDSPFGESFVGRYRDRVCRENLDELYCGRLEQDLRRAFPPRYQKVRRVVTVAAMILLIPTIVVIGMLTNRRAGSLGVFWVKGGVVELNEPGRSIVPEETRSLEPGTLFNKVPEGASLQLTLSSRGPADLSRKGFDRRGAKDGEAWLQVTGPAKFETHMSATASNFTGILRTGKLEADVRPRRNGDVFRVVTPHAEVVVVGTTFTLEVLKDETRLLVKEGVVDFGKIDGRAVAPGAVSQVLPEDGWFRVHRDGSGPKPVEVRVDADAPPPPLPAAATGAADTPPDTTTAPHLLPDLPESSRPDLDTPVTSRRDESGL